MEDKILLSMTLEEAKDKYAESKGKKNWNEFKRHAQYSKEIGYDYHIEKCLNDVFELYLSSNTAKLQEENRNLLGMLESMELTAFNIEQKVKTLTEALEKIRDNDIYDHLRVKNIANKALKTINK